MAQGGPRGPRPYMEKPKADTETRIAQLRQTIETAAAARRRDDALLTEYRRGLLRLMAQRWTP